MINVNFTLIIQVINFIFLMWFLNKYLFKPVLKMLDERANKISGDFENAEKVNKEVDEGIEKLEKEYMQAKLESSNLKNSIKNEAVQIANSKLDKAKDEAGKYLEGFYKELEATRNKAKESIDKEVNSLAKSVASLLLGREIS